MTLNFSTSNSSLYGTVESISPAGIPVVVEEYTTRYRIPITLVTQGEGPAGFYAGNASLDPPVLAISGPRSVVESIARAEAVNNLDILPGREGVTRTAIPFVLYTVDGEPVDDHLLEITSSSVLIDSVICEQTLYSKYTLPINGDALLTGTPAHGYEVASVTVTPADMNVAGYHNQLASLNRLFPEGAVSVEGRSESFTSTLKLRKPSELAYMSNDTITVSVEIRPVTATVSFANMKVSLTGLGEGLLISTNTSKAVVAFTGPQPELEKLSASDITIRCDVSGLGVGTHEVTPVCLIGDTESPIAMIQPGTITVNIRSR